jgi:WD40 repeat protein
MPKINPSPPVLPVPVPKKTPAQPVKNNNLRNRMIALGGILLLGIGITQGYGYLKYEIFPASPQLLISDLSSLRFLDKTLTGHSSTVGSVVYSPDGRYLASGSSDDTIKIWEVATGRELRTLTGHYWGVYSVVYSPDGRYLASGNGDKTIKIWEVATGKELRTLTGHSSFVESVVYSPDGRYLASGSGDKTIKIWRVGR